MKKLLLLCAPLVIACGKTEIMPTENNNTFKFSVTAETALTKTNLGENSDGTYSLTWTKGDKIGLFVADRQANCKLAFADGKFSGELVAGKPSAASVNYLAYYPYSSTSGDGYMVSNEIANIQYMPFDGTSDFMYTDPVANQYDERNMPTDMKLAFAHHLFGIVEVNVNSTDDELKGEKILSVTLSSESTVLSGTYTFDLANTGVAPKFDANRSYKNVTSEYRDPQALLDGNHAFQFVANSFTDVSDLTLTVKTTHYTFTKKAGAAVSLKAGEVTVLPTVTISGTGEKRKKVLSYFGDSIASKDLHDYLQGLLGEDWDVYMNGIPGAGDLNVAAAVGCVDLTFDESFTLPADGTEVECGKISALENLAGVKGMYNVFSKYWFNDHFKLNPITVYTDEDAVGIECELSCSYEYDNNGHSIPIPPFYLKRVHPTDQATEIKAGKSRVKTYQATHLRDADVLCIYTGTNNSFKVSDYDAVVNIHKRMRDFMTGPAKEDYIICGFHTNRYVGLHRMWTKEYAEIMEQAFGKEHMLDYKLLGLDIDKNHVPVPSGFNADATFPDTDTATKAEKQAYYEKALTLSKKVGARDFSVTETDEAKEKLNAKDRANVKVFEWPASWWGNYDNNVHPNKEGYNVMANLVYEKMKTLGYLD